MEHNNHQGWFGESFVALLAAAAGLQHSVPLPDLGIDLCVFRKDIDPVVDARIELQVKTRRVENLGDVGDGVKIDLGIGQYRCLIGRRQVPAFLVAVVVPFNPDRFTVASCDSMIVNHSAYWVSLANDPYRPRPGQKSVSVLVPSKNLLTAEVMHDLLDTGLPA
jgi:hypothetical protein